MIKQVTLGNYEPLYLNVVDMFMFQFSAKDDAEYLQAALKYHHAHINTLPWIMQ